VLADGGHAFVISSGRVAFATLPSPLSAAMRGSVRTHADRRITAIALQKYVGFQKTRAYP
jgi:hypothetical protein